MYISVYPAFSQNDLQQVKLCSVLPWKRHQRLKQNSPEVMGLWAQGLLLDVFVGRRLEVPEECVLLHEHEDVSLRRLQDVAMRVLQALHGQAHGSPVDVDPARGPGRQEGPG